MPLDKDVNLEKLAEACGNFSGADIEGLCREAAMLSIRKDDKAKKVRKEDFDEAMKNVRASITPNIIQFYKKLSGSLGTGLSKKDIADRELDVV